TSGVITSADTIASNGKVYRTGTGRAILSEGGIMPDIYIKLDTSEYTGFYRDLIEKNIINQYIYHNMIGTPPAFSIENFMDEYRLPASTYDRFIAWLRKREVDVPTRQAVISRDLIEKDMRALIAKFYFGDQAWFKIKNTGDRIVQRAIDELSKKDTAQ